MLTTILLSIKLGCVLTKESFRGVTSATINIKIPYLARVLTSLFKILKSSEQKQLSKTSDCYEIAMDCSINYPDATMNTCSEEGMNYLAQ